MANTDLELLPQKPAHLDTFQLRTRPIVTNSYRVEFLPQQPIQMYSVEILPPPPSDHRSLKLAILRAVRRDIQGIIGKFVHCGDIIFAQSSGEFIVEERIHQHGLQFQSSVREGSFSIVLTKVSQFGIDQNFHSNSGIQFLNILLRDMIKNSRLKQLGSFRNHFDVRQRIALNSALAELWPGYFTSIAYCDGGLNLLIDCCFKLVRSDTVLDVITQIHRSNPRQSQINIQNEIKNRIVITVYGREESYKVLEVDFSMNPNSSFQISDGNSTTFKQYYRQKYQQEIKDQRQPLLLSQKNNRTEPIYLVPELCRMTGTCSMDNEMDILKEISKQTRMPPRNRFEKIQKFQQIVPQEGLNKWGMQISRNPLEVQAKQLSLPIIGFNNTRINIDQKGVFNMANAELLEGIGIQRWQLFYTGRDEDNARKLVQGLKRVSQTMGVGLAEPMRIDVTSVQGRLEQQFLDSIRNNLRKECQIAVILLPRNVQASYRHIKQIMTEKMPVPSQVVQTFTAQKGNMSVFSKILVQMACKIGAVPWQVINMPPEIPSLTMIVGIDVCHDTFNQRRSVLGFSASLNANFTKYYSRIAFHEEGQQISHVLAPIFIEAFKEFFKFNQKQKPSTIIIYRDGVGTSQYDAVQNYELPQIVRAIKQFDQGWEPEIAAILVNKRINERLFDHRNGKMENPYHGLVVDQGIVRRHFNWFAVNHYCNSGTLTPTHFNVIVYNCTIPPNALYQFTYNLCYLYFNWSGGVRVPAPCMHAHKIAYLVGKHTGVDFANNLANKLFYL